MDWQLETIHVDLSNILEIARGDQDRFLKYLRQFVELVPVRCTLMQDAVGQRDRERIRAVVHSMKPQVLFFGVKGVAAPIESIENEFESMPIEHLNELVRGMLQQFTSAAKEIDAILTEHFPS